MFRVKALLSLIIFHDCSLGLQSTLLDLVNPLIGNGGSSPDNSGGMIPSVSPPFGTTRWVAQTQPSIVSRTPYNVSNNDIIRGFMGTRQPAIWMGETAPVIVVPGMADTASQITAKFQERGMKKKEGSEKISVGSYAVSLDVGQGVDVRMSASSRIGYLSFTFTGQKSELLPHIILQASRPTSFYSVSPSLVGGTIPYFPVGNVTINIEQREICGWSSERQDTVITPMSTAEAASNFKGYFCARFDVPFTSFGIIRGSQGTTQGNWGAEGSDGPDETIEEGEQNGQGSILSAFARFEWPSAASNFVVNVMVSTSFISIDQARKTLQESTDIHEVIIDTEDKWLEKIGRFEFDNQASKENKTVFLTGVFHALQYPYEQSEGGKYRSAHDDQIYEGESFTGYSIWDTYRAEWAFLLIFAPERIPAMIQSMLQDYKQSGWLPMWKNFAETNIMVGTHADSLIAEAVVKGFREGFDMDLAWEAVHKDATVPPVSDTKTLYYDREEGVDFEVRAGLSSVYAQKGWVADDLHSESASRTLAYAYDDYAAYKLAEVLNKPSNVTSFLRNRAHTAPFTLYNPSTGFMEARNADGTWAGDTRGWTEGDKWAYSFDVVHDIPTLIEKRGGNASFIKSLDEHFDGGHNDHSNEPSHHIPYLYALAGAPAKTQERVRAIASSGYNDTAWGLSGNEDCGQMSAWYIFSAMGFYPVNPVSGEYVVGSPFFDKLTILLPPRPYTTPKISSPYYDKSAKGYKLTISAPGARTKPYVKALTVNGRKVNWPVIRHEDIFLDGGEVIFEMSDKPESWGTLGSQEADGWHIEL